MPPTRNIYLALTQPADVALFALARAELAHRRDLALLLLLQGLQGAGALDPEPAAIPARCPKSPGRAAASTAHPGTARQASDGANGE